jgi:hypothetical protein
MSSGTPSLDTTACAALVSRARYIPAQDGGGILIASEKLERIAWAMPNYPSTRPAPMELADIVAVVNKLPQGKSRVDVTVGQIIRADGSIESCTVQVPSEFAAIDKLACEVLAQQPSGGPIMNAASQPVRGMRVRRIGFKVENAVAN